MRAHLGTIHRWVGLATVVVFLASGLYMRWLHLEQLPLDAGLRILYRSRHVYLLFSGLLNLAVGLRFAIPSRGRGSRVALAGSLLLLLSPTLMIVGFVREPIATGQLGPATALGVFAAALGFGAHALGGWRGGS